MPDTELDKQNQRIYNLSDRLSASEAKLVEHTTILVGLIRQMELTNATMVNRDLLTATVGTVVAKIEGLHQENGLKFNHVDSLFRSADSKLDTMITNMNEKLDAMVVNTNEKIDPIRKVINWSATIIVGAVIVALLSLVIKGI